MLCLKIGVRQRRWLLIPQLLLAVVIALLLAASNYQTSQAASLAPQLDNTHCANPGIQVDTFAINDRGGYRVGELDIYYNSLGYNCAYTRLTASASGKISMKVVISSCQETKKGGVWIVPRYTPSSAWCNLSRVPQSCRACSRDRQPFSIWRIG
jgi:hypothetical protein